MVSSLYTPYFHIEFSPFIDSIELVHIDLDDLLASVWIKIKVPVQYSYMTKKVIDVQWLKSNFWGTKKYFFLDNVLLLINFYIAVIF